MRWLCRSGVCRFFGGFLLVAALSSCATQQAPYVPAEPDSARIRVFHGPGTYIYIDSQCTDDPKKEIFATAGGFSFIVPNKRIGMPATEDMHFSFHEYAIPAGRVVSVVMYGSKSSLVACHRQVREFIPAAGHDYDATLILEGHACHVRVRELVNVDEKGMATPVLLPHQWIPLDYKCLRKHEEELIF